jgi:hypothetical protein
MKNLKEMFKNYYENNKEGIALAICGCLMLNGNTNTYKLYESLR